MSSIGVQLYAVREAFSQDRDAALARLASMGLTQVEAFAFTDDAPGFRASLEAAGLSAPSAHAPLIDAADPRPLIDAAAEIGTRLLIDPFTAAERWTSSDGVARLAERMNELGVLVREAGMTFGYHNHFWETQALLDGRHALEVLVDDLEPDVALEVDAFWAAFGGADVPALLGRLGERVQAIHVKDGAFVAQPPSLEADFETVLSVVGPVELAQQPAGSGDVDVAAVLAAAPASALHVIEFDDYAGDVFDGIATSLAWLRQHES